MEINFDGKRALVTGAGKGIGRGVAIRLAESGADVVAISRTKSDLDDLKSLHDKIQTVLLDITDWEKTKSVIQDIGPIDLLVNNAGIASEQKKLGTLEEEEIDRLYSINVKAVINITQIVAEGMKERGQGGSIVNVSSIGALRGGPTIAIYGSSKAAMDQLTRCMAVEYGPHNIRVNSVNPTAIRTRMTAELFEQLENDESSYIRYFLNERTPLRKFGEVDDVAYPVLFLLSDKASLITGVVLPIDGGFSCSF